MSATASDRLQQVGPFAQHAEQHRPLVAYGALVLAFNGAVAAGVETARRRRALPRRWSAADLLLLGAATAKLSRLIAKDRVLAFARAPFTEFQDDTQRGEVEESARGTGLQRAIGELVVCEYCPGPVGRGRLRPRGRAYAAPHARGGRDVHRLRDLRRAEHRPVGG
jgi:hypothetical protein